MPSFIWGAGGECTGHTNKNVSCERQVKAESGRRHGRGGLSASLRVHWSESRDISDVGAAGPLFAGSRSGSEKALPM